MLSKLIESLEDGSYKLPFNSPPVILGGKIAGGINQLVLSHEQHPYWEEVEASRYEAIKVKYFMHITWEGSKESRYYDPIYVEPMKEFKDYLNEQCNSLSDIAHNMGVRWEDTEELPYMKDGIAHLNGYMIEASLFVLSSALGCDYRSSMVPQTRHEFIQVMERITWSWLVSGVSNLQYRLAKIDTYNTMLHRYRITVEELVAIFRKATRQLLAIQEETK